MRNGSIQSVLVLGGGSAGFLAAITLKTKLPVLRITVLRSKELGIIGVGEGTTPGVPLHLFGYLGLDQAEFYALARPTWKLGLRFLWGPRPYFNYTFRQQCDWKWSKLPKWNGYYCRDDFEFVEPQSALMTFDNAFVRQKNGDPFVGSDWGFHIENEKFVDYLERHARRIGVDIVDGMVAEVLRDDAGVSGLRLQGGATAQADLHVDCSGFRSLLIGRTFEEPYISFKPTLFCDRAVVGGWDRSDRPIKPYTTVETMNAGWCWQIEHENRVIRGYVYSSDFITDAEAEAEFRAKNPSSADTRVIKFPSGRYRNAWVKNAVAIGNAAGFVEPLEATSLAVICSESRLLAELLMGCELFPTDSFRRIYNRLSARAWDEIRDFLGVHYRYNTRLDTPFWRACRSDVDIGEAREFVDFYRENGPNARGSYLLPRPIAESIFGIEGYLTLLVGQRVPYQREHQPTANELEVWRSIQSQHREMGRSGISVRAALRAIRSPAWKWNPEFFKGEAQAHMARTGV